MFSKILIANRGEIAVRIIRACRELGVQTVAVYSEPDQSSLHVELADEAVCVGGASPADSYLNISSIISAAEITDSDAIHPGYGFLAENADFARICDSCGIKFIGPTHKNITDMGNKVKAKESMRRARVPLIPGSDGVIKSKDEALKVAEKIGYPVILKAKAGGGGRGMRICHSDVRLISAFITAQSEAKNAFGDSGIYLEKFLENPHHIEIQLVADNYGNVIYLGERDCSIQRRHQKIIEEAPSPFLNNHLRRKMGELAVRGAKFINYTNLGTMEFLVDKNKDFYFMEMNTRVQVEHPVTEEITNTDIIKMQIELAAGQKLKMKQSDVKIQGAAIECRINAEDPENNFMPSAGTMDFCFLPGGRGTRVDTHVYGGYRIPPFYDSLIAKLITKGTTRKEALMRMDRALHECLTDPVKTTAGFCQKVINSSGFKRGSYDTSFLNKFLKAKER